MPIVPKRVHKEANVLMQPLRIARIAHQYTGWLSFLSVVLNGRSQEARQGSA
jgi:hypothetical protein